MSVLCGWGGGEGEWGAGGVGATIEMTLDKYAAFVINVSL